MIGALKQVQHLYITDDAINAAVQACVSSVVQYDTRVVIGHSLGSVVAYEALCAHPEWPVKRLVTLGSPLGWPNLVFDRLKPSPSNGIGVWPGALDSWINIADMGDVVALVKWLRGPFGDRVDDVLINNGVEAHDVKRYLSAEETGRAISGGLLT
jgi:pimeloyl-ACP methyl ester carboxylesterase